MELGGRTVLLTGSAGGIGAAIARELAAAGCRLVLLDVEEAGLEAIARDIGEMAISVRADVTDLAQVESAVSAGRDRFGPIGVVIANAAIDEIAPIAEIDPAAFDRVVAVNLGGAFRTVRAALSDIVAERASTSAPAWATP